MNPSFNIEQIFTLYVSHVVLVSTSATRSCQHIHGYHYSETEAIADRYISYLRLTTASAVTVLYVCLLDAKVHVNSQVRPTLNTALCQLSNEDDQYEFLYQPEARLG